MEKVSVSSRATCKSNSEFFPIAMPILYGPIDIPGFHDTQGTEFPKNVTFKQVNGYGLCFATLVKAYFHQQLNPVWFFEHWIWLVGLLNIF